MTLNQVTSFDRHTTEDRVAAPAQKHTIGRRRVMRPKIGLFGYFGCGNLGNEGSLEAMIAFLRRERPDAELICICPSPEAVRNQHSVDTLNITTPVNARWFDRLNRLLLKVPFRLLNIVRTFQQVRHFDYLVVPGTGILDDLGARPGGMPYALVRWFLFARLWGCKIGLVSIGAGPIVNPTNQRLLKLAARLAHYRSYRDAISKDFMTKLGLDTSADPVVADIAFGLERPQVDQRDRDDRRLTIGIGVMNYHGWFHWSETALTTNATYLDALAQLSMRLLEKGYRVRLVIGEDSDREAVDAVVDKITASVGPPDGEQLVTEPAASLNDVMRQMADCDVVVATRYHNIVCAMNVGRPVISLGYARKNDVLLHDAGLEGFAQHCENFDVETILGQIEEQVRDRITLSERVGETARRYRRLLKEQEEQLLANWI